MIIRFPGAAPRKAGRPRRCGQEGIGSIAPAVPLLEEPARQVQFLPRKQSRAIRRRLPPPRRDLAKRI